MSAPLLGSASPVMSNDVIIDCSHTRYHVVRAAACMVGWTIDDSGTEEKVPTAFHGVPLPSHRDGTLAHPPQVIWIDKSVLSARVAGLPCYQRINHFPAMHVIARKAFLFRRLMQLARLAHRTEAPVQESAPAAHSTSSLDCFFVSSIPPSFSSIGDLGRLAAYQQQLTTSAADVLPPFFIVKPNTGCEGRGIRLTASPLESLTEAERTDKKQECIIQLYVDRPLLLEGKKFDLRLYVLLVSVTPAPPPSQRRATLREGGVATGAASAVDDATDPTADAVAAAAVPRDVDGVRLYVHREGLVRICAEPYASPTEANCTDALLHLTNYAVNKKSALFRPAHDGKETEDAQDGHDAGRVVGGEGNKRSLAALAAHIDGLRVPGGWAAVQRRIDECIALTVLSGVEVLRRELISAGGARGDRADGRGCFELLGFDVMLREGTLEPVLMEVNHSPSLFCDTAFDFAVKSAVLRDTFAMVGTHLPPWEAHEGQPKHYASATCAGSSSAAKMDRAEAALLSGEAAPCGFRSLLPHYGGCGSDACPITEDWQPDERMAQEYMVKLSKQLR